MIALIDEQEGLIAGAGVIMAPEYCLPAAALALLDTVGPPHATASSQRRTQRLAIRRLRAARGGDDKFVALLLEYHALVDLPSKEGITPLMAAAGVDYGSRVTRGRNRTDEGVLASMDLLIKAGANVNARSLLDRNLALGPRGGGAGRH